jgi:hypothetical protein
MGTGNFAPCAERRVFGFMEGWEAFPPFATLGPIQEGKFLPSFSLPEYHPFPILTPSSLPSLELGSIALCHAASPTLPKMQTALAG